MSDAFSPLRLQELVPLLDGERTGADAVFAEVGIDSRRLPAGAPVSYTHLDVYKRQGAKRRRSFR